MKFKVGDRIKRVSGEIGDRLKIGDIGIIKAILIGTNSYRVINERTREVQTWGDDYIDIEPSQTIVIYPKGLETIALLKEGHKVIKQASAKCNPSDTYDFNIGAKLAFQRLMGEEVTTGVEPYREVKRPAEVGEWVKIIDAKPSVTTTMDYKNGDILQIIHLDGSYRHYGKNSTDYLYDEEYVVLENYQPEVTKTLSDYTNKELIDEISKRLEDKQ